MKIVKIILISILLFSGLINIALAAASPCTTLEIALPGVGKKVGDHWEVCGPADYLAGIYKLSLGIGVFLAAVVIVMAGIKFAISGDNAGLQKEAREDIFQAVFGLLILFGSVIILKTIDPNLADLGKLENLPEISLPPSSSSGSGPSPECLEAMKKQADCRKNNCTALLYLDPTAYNVCAMNCTLEFPTTICNK